VASGYGVQGLAINNTIADRVLAPPVRLSNFVTYEISTGSWGHKANIGDGVGAICQIIAVLSELQVTAKLLGREHIWALQSFIGRAVATGLVQDARSPRSLSPRVSQKALDDLNAAYAELIHECCVLCDGKKKIPAFVPDLATEVLGLLDGPDDSDSYTEDMQSSSGSEITSGWTTPRMSEQDPQEATDTDSLDAVVRGLNSMQLANRCESWV